MKKLFTLSLALLIGSTVFAKVQADDFAFDSQAFEIEMAALNQLELEVQQNNWSMSDLAADDQLTSTFGNLNLQHASFSVDNMDWNSFAWGFCCWPIGFFVVAINDNKSSDQKLSFWIGMGVNVVLGAISAVSAPAGTFNITP